MEGITNMEKYWESLNKIDRADLMETVYIAREIGFMEFYDIPSHIKAVLYNLWFIKWQHLNHELNP